MDRATGELLWATEVCAGSPLGGIMVSAAYDGDRIYLTCNDWTQLSGLPNFDDERFAGEAAALDPATGEVVWSTPLTAPSFGAISSAGGLVWLTEVRGRIVALDTETGAEVWSDQPSDRAASGVTVANGRVFFGHGFSMFKAPEEVVGGFTVYALP